MSNIKGKSKRKSGGKSDLKLYPSSSPVKEKWKENVVPDETFVDKVLKKADSLMETFDFDLARKFYKRVLECEPDHLPAIESLIEIHLQFGELEEAEKYLFQSVTLSPDKGYRKYLALGQIKGGKEAIGYYEKGIQVLRTEHQNGPSESSPEWKDFTATRQNDLSNAYCAMAEVYMTDLCDEEDAEDTCQTFIENAIAADESNAEAYQCLASFQLVKNEMEDAKKSMEKSLSLWLPNYRLSKEEENETCPLTYDVRLGASKLLIELEMFDEATEILEDLMEEDDEVVVVWYTLGLLNYLRGKDYCDNTRYYFKNGLELCKKLDLEYEHMEQVEHMKQILSEIPLLTDDENEEDVDDDDDDYETVSEEEEMEP